MNELEALVSLNMAADIGSVRLKKLLEYFGKPENILKAPKDKLIKVSGVGENIAQKICAIKTIDLDKEFKTARKLSLNILIQSDPGYPRNLKNIYDPPIVLYVKGQFREVDLLGLGVVGSRRASFYGLTCAEKFSAELSAFGFTIVSGMARGIDTCAHKGALKALGRTIAVIGSGFKHIYPPENRRLCDEISSSGAVISEFSISTEPLPHNFPRRNRVISGLSLGVLVVEAAQNSGALITADFALEQSRDVFALPGKVDSCTSFGTNSLIKQGAKLVCCVEDIIEEYGMLPQAQGEKTTALCRRHENIQSGLLNNDEIVYGVLSPEPVIIDEIAQRTKFGIPEISAALLRLQLKKMAKQLPGKQFIRSKA